jgi:predicted TIM-barrel fold metal-dependent hydrolase
VPSPALFAERVRSAAGIVGFRILAASPDGSDRRHARLAARRWEPALAAAERAGIPVVIFAPLHMPLVAAVADGHPELRVIVDHLGLPPPPSFPVSPRFLDTIPELLALARAPNVAVKLTGAPALSAAPYPFDDLWPMLHRILAAFGPDRVMWGSDFTQVTGRSQHPRHPGGRHTYAELVGYLRATTELGDAEKAALFGGTVRAWFGWHPDPAAG